MNRVGPEERSANAAAPHQPNRTPPASVDDLSISTLTKLIRLTRTPASFSRGLSVSTYRRIDVENDYYQRFRLREFFARFTARLKLKHHRLKPVVSADLLYTL